MNTSWILVLLLTNLISLLSLGGALIWQREKLKKMKETVDKATDSLQSIQSSASYTTLVEQKSIIDETQETLQSMIQALSLESSRSDELQTRLDLALTSSNMGIWEIELDDNTVVWSPMMYEIYDRHINEVQTSDQWMHFILPEDRHLFSEQINKLVSQDIQTAGVIYRILTPKGLRKTIQSSFVVELSQDGVAERIVGVNKDISNVYEVENMKNQLISMAAHELRSPLTSVTWFTHLLKEEAYDGLTDKHQDFLDEIEQGGFRMMALIKNLLQFSRVEMGLFITDSDDYTVVDVNPIIEDVQKNHANTLLNKAIHWHSSFDPDPLSVVAHQESLEIIFSNLLSNAIKYSNPQGTISCTVKVKNCKESFYYKEIPWEQGLCIRIADNGIGIPSHEQDKIYEKMYRGEDASKYHMYGTGVGLYMVQKVVSEVGGKIWFSSKEGHGTVFFVMIPVN